MLIFALGILIDKLQEEILTWPEATAEQHLFGGINFRINNGRDTGIEMGHVHGDHLNDLSFPMQIRNNLVNTGCISAHHVLSQSGWVSYWIKNENDITAV